MPKRKPSNPTSNHLKPQQKQHNQLSGDGSRWLDGSAVHADHLRRLHNLVERAIHTAGSCGHLVILSKTAYRSRCPNTF
ncbi:MAG: hypothetical protein HOE44_13530 [Candidatus Marinimicrobia bacterium]|nr:hypothetical protein [Candidatus Neomarinimicrobiota bacterium]